MQWLLRAESRSREGERRMMLRRLKPEEHPDTRQLWEEIFCEDTKEFLDYYYFIKARSNEIYVVEEDGRICSMLHLNPYVMRIEEEEFPSDYIVAVATREAYRGRGYMGELLRRTMKEMHGRGVPFTFLMPAAEAIYTPYDFRFIYRQETGMVETGGRPEEPDHDVTSMDARLWDADALSAFFTQNFSGRWQVCTKRDEEYFRTMILEQQSERGGVRILKKGERMIGTFAYAEEDGLEIREPLILPGCEEVFESAVRRLASFGDDAVKVYGYSGGVQRAQRPLIMARILSLPTLLGAMKVPSGLAVDCSFAVIDPLIRQNSRIWRVQSLCGEEKISVRESEDSEGVIPIAELTELLFGVRTVEEIRGAEHVIITDHLAEELEKIIKLKRVFINEVV